MGGVQTDASFSARQMRRTARQARFQMERAAKRPLRASAIEARRIMRAGIQIPIRLPGRAFRAADRARRRAMLRSGPSPRRAFANRRRPNYRTPARCLLKQGETNIRAGLRVGGILFRSSGIAGTAVPPRSAPLSCSVPGSRQAPFPGTNSPAGVPSAQNQAICAALLPSGATQKTRERAHARSPQTIDKLHYS